MFQCISVVQCSFKLWIIDVLLLKISCLNFNCLDVNYTNNKKVMVKCSRYRPGVAERVGRGIALLFP